MQMDKFMDMDSVVITENILKRNMKSETEMDTGTDMQGGFDTT